MPGPFETDASGPAQTSADESTAELSRATRRITTAGSIDEILSAIAEEARRLIGAHQAVASRTTDQGDWAQATYATSLSERYANWRDYDTSPDGSGIYALVSQTNQPMRLTQAELEAHPAWKGFGAEADRHPPMRGWLAVPLVGREGQNIGLVQVSDKYDGGDFAERDETLLVELANVAAIAVENAQLYEVAQQRLGEVQAERRQLAEIFREAPSSMCITSGPDHVYERANDHYLALVGHSDVIGKPVREVLPETVEQGFIELLNHVYRTGEPYVGKDVFIRLVSPELDGPVDRWVDFVYQPIRDAEGAITGIYTQAIDLTERKRVEEALRASEQRLKETNESLEEQVAARTAQLRALAAELNQTEQRERRRLSQILHDDLQQLLVAGQLQLYSAMDADDAGQAAQAMERVESLLEQSISKTRSLTADLSPPVLHDAGLAPALRSLGHWMGEQQGLQVAVDASESAEIDEQDLRVLLFQAIRELLFNVVKHAQADHAEVTLRRTGDDRVEATVVDAGRGFDPAASESASSDNSQFGLFSLRERLAWLGGEMTIDSAPGKGTRVVLSVPEPTRANEVPTPVERPRKPVSASERREPSDREQATAIKVVIADDHTIVRQGLVSALSGEPDIAVVGEAADGQEAIDLVRQTEPDVVLLDVSMPTMGGIEAAEKITAEFDDVRVIGLSMHDDAHMATAMRAAGATAYVNKAQASDHLLDAIRGRAD